MRAPGAPPQGITAWLGPGRETLAWVAAYLAVRFLVELAAAPELYRIDELYAGAAAEELVAGRGLPLAGLPHAPYCGGPVLVIGAAMALFPLTGSLVFVLRLLSIAISAGTFLAWTAIAGRLLGPRARRLVALLFVLPPPEYTKLTVMAWGNHAESTLPTALAFLALVALHGAPGSGTGAPGLLSPRPGPRSRARALGLAFLGGSAGAFASFFSYAGVAPLGALGLLVLLLGRGGLGAGLGAAWIAGVAAGAVPAVLVALGRDLEGPSFLVAFLGKGAPAVLLRALHFALFPLREYLGPHLGLGTALEGLYWAAVGIASLSALARLRRLRPGRFLPAAIVWWLPATVYVLVVAASEYPVGPESQGILAYRYLSPLTPLLLVLLGGELARLGRRAGLAAALVLVTPNLASLARGIGSVDGRVLGLTGSSYLAYGAHAIEVQGFDPLRNMEHLEAIPDPERRRVALEAAATTYAAYRHWEPPDAPLAPQVRLFLAKVRGLPRHRSLYMERYALVLEARRVRVPQDDYPELAALLAAEPAAEVEPLARPLLLALAAAQGGDRVRLDAALRMLPEELRPRGAEALGILALRQDPADLGELPAEAGLRRGFLRGAGEEWAQRRLAWGYPVLAEPRGLGSAERVAFGEGVRAVLVRHQGEDPLRQRIIADRAGLAPLIALAGGLGDRR